MARGQQSLHANGVPAKPKDPLYAITSADRLDGGPIPRLLVAVTLQVYFLPCVLPVIGSPLFVGGEDDLQLMGCTLTASTGVDAVDALTMISCHHAPGLPRLPSCASCDNTYHASSARWCWHKPGAVLTSLAAANGRGKHVIGTGAMSGPVIKAR